MLPGCLDQDSHCIAHELSVREKFARRLNTAAADEVQVVLHALREVVVDDERHCCTSILRAADLRREHTRELERSSFITRSHAFWSRFACILEMVNYRSPN